MCILGSFQDMRSECITYNDIILVFREFGNMLYNIMAVTPNGILEDDVELYSFTSHIMEFFADDDEIIDMFADGMSKTNIDRLKLSRRIDSIINVFMHYSTIYYTVQKMLLTFLKMQKIIWLRKTYYWSSIEKHMLRYLTM
jgi:hypothetical protein